MTPNTGYLHRYEGGLGKSFVKVIDARHGKAAKRPDDWELHRRRRADGAKLRKQVSRQLEMLQFLQDD